MEAMQRGFSQWFYLGLLAVVFGAFLIYKAKGRNKSKSMENGYFILILGMVGIISEWTDFATVLLLLVLFAGTILIIDRVFLSKRRKSTEAGVPHYVHYAREFFPVVLIVWILRAFLFEAYQIPSSSMRPDLTVGDFILVNKFTYGIREPFTNKVLIEVNKVRRGDVIVFKDPNARNRDLIKRVVGIGGDKISYYNKRLTINDKPLTYLENGTYNYTDHISADITKDFVNQRFIENLTGVNHSIITFDEVPPVFLSQVMDFKGRENCTYQGNDGFTCVVPQGKYFMMGDNRDNSFDSRYWGFVSEEAILGRAIYVWLNLHELSRSGTKI
ncbi:MAG: lepB [Burkholderiales bacterium]|jgi:signal peptidase I|nr:lepB [Burkholderiales bacterium]